MTNELPDQTKRAVEEFIDEGGYQVGEPGPHMSEQRIAAVLDELDARLDDALPDGTELERALARVDAYQFFMARVLGTDTES